MQLSKHLKEESIHLNFSLPDRGEDYEWTIKNKREFIFKSLVSKFETIGRISNTTKLYNEFEEREKKDSCCIGDYIALPHLRTLQCKDLLISILTCPEGIDFGAFDQMPIKVFFAFVAPPYNDGLYKILYKNIAELFGNPYCLDILLQFEKPGELIRYLKQEIS